MEDTRGHEGLTPRERTILETLVECFIQDADPVSSSRLRRAGGLDLSSATIRNVLHGLEEKGYLYQPHTSAGRIPTAAAYREYVESLRPARLPASWVRRIRRELRECSSDVHELLQRFSGLLAGFTSNVGVGMAMEDPHDACIERIEVVQLESLRILVVVTLDDGEVRTGVVPLGTPISLRSLEVAVQTLNDLVVGYAPAEARDRLDLVLDPGLGEAYGIARSILNEGEHLFQGRSSTTLHLEGASRIMGQPEFEDPENLRLLIRILDHPQTLAPLLAAREGAAGPSIRIGVEVEEGPAQPLSLVFAPAHLGGHTAVLGILGPMRMEYRIVLSLVSSVADSVHRLEASASSTGTPPAVDATRAETEVEDRGKA